MTRSLSPAMLRAREQIADGNEAAHPSTRRLARLGLLQVDPALPTDPVRREVEIIARKVAHKTPFVLTERARQLLASAAERRRRRQCPACGRGNALARVRSTDGLLVGSRCRWCGFERFVDADSALTKNGCPATGERTDE